MAPIWRFPPGPNSIINKERQDLLKKYNVTADVRTDGRNIDPIITVDGVKTRLYNFLMNTNTNVQCVDHINHQTLDNRVENLRNGSELQNLCNTVKGIGRVVQQKNGKLGIILPSVLGIDTSNYQFDSIDAAKCMLKQLVAKHEKFKDWTEEASKQIADEIETHEFTADKWVDRWAESGTMKDIMELPPSSELNTRLRNMKVLSKSKAIYPDQEWMMQHKLMHDYNKLKNK